jgi:serine kinase of HPr protein (carbohydrate metabolism regulator)
MTASGMTDDDDGTASIHATAVLVGDRAILIRGPSGAGKSRLAFELILAGRAGQIAKATLVGDDRVFLDVCEGQLVVRPAPQLAGLIEIYGLGIRRCDFVETAVLGLVVDLAAPDAERLPPPSALRATIRGVEIPRIPVGVGLSPLPLVAAALTTTSQIGHCAILTDCAKGNGNHIRLSIATE